MALKISTEKVKEMVFVSEELYQKVLLLRSTKARMHPNAKKSHDFGAIYVWTPI